MNVANALGSVILARGKCGGRTIIRPVVASLGRHQRQMAPLSTSLREELSRKEKVEEDLFMRQQEKEWIEKLKVQHELETTAKQQAFRKKVVQPIMEELRELLKETGDEVSEEALQRLAMSKLHYMNLE